MSIEKKYFSERNNLLANLEVIRALEEHYTAVLLNEVILPITDKIVSDFTARPLELLPFWINYPPEQRGRAFTGKSIPWLEVGEKTIGSNLIRQLSLKFPDITFPGLPTGGDIRFATKNVYIHLDIKMTGPNDNPNEVVVPPNQVSGDGKFWINNGFANSPHPIHRVGNGSFNYNFQPKLPPFYLIDHSPYICLTFFLDAIYSVNSFGDHPNEHFEFSCVPNGLLMFDGPNYCKTTGLLIAGKDDNTKAENTKRIRIRLNPLSSIDKWRTTIIYKENGIWKTKSRQ